MIMCSIMLCSRIQRCLAAPQTCVACAGKSKDSSKAALIATSRALAACRNNSSSSICASTRSSTGWPTVVPPFSDHAITLGVPGHLVGTENRCPSPPAAYADQQQLSSHLHEWLEAALLQHANIHTGNSHNDQIAAAASAADAVSPSASSRNSSHSAADGSDWEQLQDSAVADSIPQPAQKPSSTSGVVVATPSSTHSLDDVEVPFAGLFAAAALQDSSSPLGEPGSSSSSSLDLGARSEVDDQEGVVPVQDATVPMQQEVQSESSSHSSNSSDGGWSVLSNGPS